MHLLRKVRSIFPYVTLQCPKVSGLRKKLCTSQSFLFFHFFLKVSYLFSVTETYYNIVLHRSLVFNEKPITYIQESSLVTSPRWHFVYLTDPLCIPPFIPGSLDSKCKPTVTFLPGSSVAICQISLSYIATAHTISPPPITKQALQAGKHCFKN